MRRRTVTLLCVAALCATACSPGSQPPGPGGGGGRISVQAFGGEAELAALREVIAAFERSNPGARVELVAVPDQKEHVARLATSFAGGSPPDVFLLNYRRFGQFAARGVISPAAERLGNLRPAEFYPQPLEAFTFEGRLTCLPQNVSSLVVYYNADLFRAAGLPAPRAGWTWDDLRSAAERLSTGAVKGVGFDPSLVRLAPFVWSAGGEVVDSVDAPTRVTLDTAPARRAVDYLLGLQRSGAAPSAAERAAEAGEDRFARGQLGMWLDSRRITPTFRRITGFRWDVAPLPVAEEPVTLLHSDAYCVAKASGSPELAHAFAAYAVGAQGAPVAARTGRTVPALRSVAESPAFLDPTQPPPSARVFLDTVPQIRRLPNVAAWSEAEDIATDVLEQLFAGRLETDAALRRIEEETARTLARR